MRPQHQTKFGGVNAPVGEVGNCFAACVATLLDLDLAEVPNFCAAPDAVWYEQLQAWLRPRGLFMISFRSSDRSWAPKDSLSIAGGPGPRGHDHAVIYDGHGLVFDPHPSGTGLVQITDHSFFVKLVTR